MSAVNTELLNALKAALSTMELQLGRELGLYTLSQASMKRIWGEAVNQGRIAIKRAEA